MRNLKKSLALVLAVLMVFGLCTIGAGAAFKDSADIQYTTAVDVMAGMGILEGVGDDVFNASGNLTRAAAAKIVAYVGLGKAIAEKLPATEVFNDVKTSHWAAKYIAYLSTKGIINGYGNGNFGPEDSVTMLQFAKMLLGTAGYGKEGEYTGANWEITTMIHAEENGIFKNLKSTDLDRVITREEAALFAFNTMTNVNIQTYSATNGYADKKVNNATVTLGAEKYNYEAVSGVVTENQATGNKYTVIGGTKNLNIITDKDLIGHYVTAYYNNTLVAGTYYNVYSYEDVGTVKTYAAKDATNGLAKTLGVAAVTPIAPATDVVNTADYVNSFTNYKVDTTLASLTDALYGTYVLFGGKVVSFIADATYTVDKVTALPTATSDNVVFSALGAKDKTLVTGYENLDLKKNPYVNVVLIGSIYNLTPVTIVPAVTISKYSATTTTANGTTYTNLTIADGNNSGMSISTGFNTPYDFYVDMNGKLVGNVASATGVVAPDVYVTKTWSVLQPADQYGNVSTLYYAQTVDMAGEVKVYNVDADVNTALELMTPGSNIVDKLCSVTIYTSKGVEYATFTDVGTYSTLATAIAKTDLKIAANDYYASDVKFIWVDGDGSAIKTKVVDGRADVAVGSDVAYKAVADGTAFKVSYVIIDAALPATAGTTPLYSNGAVSNGTIALGATYAVYNGKDALEIVADANGAAVAQGFFSYEIQATGKYKLTAYAGAKQVDQKITRLYNGLLSTAGVADQDATDANIINLIPFSTVSTLAEIAALVADPTKAVNVSFTYANGKIANLYLISIS